MVGFYQPIKRFIPQFEHLYGSANKTISADCAVLPIHHLSNEFHIRELASDGRIWYFGCIDAVFWLVYFGIEESVFGIWNGMFAL